MMTTWLPRRVEDGPRLDPAGSVELFWEPGSEAELDGFGALVGLPDPSAGAAGIAGDASVVGSAALVVVGVASGVVDVMGPLWRVGVASRCPCCRRAQSPRPRSWRYRRLVTATIDIDDPATDPFAVAEAAARQIAAATGITRHDVALVLGSGWGGAADLLGETVAEVPAADIVGFSAPAVAGHGATIRSIRIDHDSDLLAGEDAYGEDKYALVLGSRTHFYEDKGVRRVAHGVRTAAAAGARTVVLTNGCGGLVPEWAPGTPVLINDHINLTAASPLEGATFVDLTDLYSPRLRDLAREVDASLAEGVYVQFRGPHYETPAEVRMAGVLGGHLVGMSTTLEAIAARQAGLEILGISLVTNAAAGISPDPLSHEEVIEAGRLAGPRISALLAAIVRKL